MKQQKLRKCLQLISLLLFPVTIYYLSPYLIINAAFHSVVNGSFIVFCLMTVLSIPFGRLFCAYLCPAGSIQEAEFDVKDKKTNNKRGNIVKYVIWAVWLSAVTACYIINGISEIDPFFMTDHGISVSEITDFVIYYGIILLIFLPSLIWGKRALCHYICWMAPFMVLGTKIRRLLHLPGLHIKAADKNSCVSCGKCSNVCPMSLDVVSELKNGSIKNLECIQCGACAAGCPKKVLKYDFSAEN